MISKITAENRIREILNGDVFRGGNVRNITFLDPNMVFINTEYRMDANTMVSLINALEGHIICGNVKGDTLVFQYGVKDKKETFISKS